nr:tetratricopeptide repeat protein [Chloroflexia bacterium]
RFGMLETVSEFAGEQLAAHGELEMVRGQHARYFLALGEAAAPHLRVAGQTAWMDRLEAEHPNLRAALAWLLAAREGEEAVRLAGALWWFWYIRGYPSEGQQWLSRTLASGGSSIARAAALVGAGWFALDQGDVTPGLAALEEAVALQRAAGDRQGIATALNWLGNAYVHERQYARAEQIHTEVLALRRQLDDQPGIAASLANLAGC